MVIYAPVWDIAVSRYFFENGSFAGRGNLFLQLMDKGIPEFWVGVAVLIGIIWMYGRINNCRWLWGIDTKFMLMTTGTMAIGPFLIVNFIFKSFWGRARPFDIVEFGGDKLFSRPLEISNQCSWDCSFMSGHTAVSFWVLSLALLAPKKYRLAAVLAAIVAGCAAAWSRLYQGYHFLSDVVFAAFVTTLVVLAMYQKVMKKG